MKVWVFTEEKLKDALISFYGEGFAEADHAKQVVINFMNSGTAESLRWEGPSEKESTGEGD